MRRTINFLLYDWLKVESLQVRPRFTDHSRETFDSVLDTCEKIAREKFAPFNRIADTEEPWFDGEKVHLPESSHAAARAYAQSGMLAAAQDYEIGGMQLPCVVEMAANSFFSKAGIGAATTSSSPMTRSAKPSRERRTSQPTHITSATSASSCHQMCFSVMSVST